MYIFITLMVLGTLLGYAMHRFQLKWIKHFITLFIWLLLFLLGIEIGANETIITNLTTIGLDASLISIAETLGSVIAAWFLWRLVIPKKKRYER